MSWLVSSIATSLKLDDDDDDDNHHRRQTNSFSAGEDRPAQIAAANHVNGDDHQSYASSPLYDEESGAPKGVKEDLSELTDTLTRQLWGVASFLAPPPQISDEDRACDPQSDDSELEYDDEGAEMRNDSGEFGGNFEAEVSNVEEFGSEEYQLSVEDYARRGVVGVTEEIVTFARNIALHPETWIDFPLPDDDIENDYELSDAQREHALAVECLAPELAAIRIELCLSYMSEACFWKIYFALVHPRLCRHDAEILSTPEIVKARAMLSQELHSHTKPKSYESSNYFADNTVFSHEEHWSVPVVDKFESIPCEVSDVGPCTEPDFELEKHALISTEIPLIDKRVIEEVPMRQTTLDKATAIISKFIDHQYEDDDTDDWLEEVNSEADVLKVSCPPGDYDDISFSDLEDDEDVPPSFKRVEHPNHKVSRNYLVNKDSDAWLDIKEC